MTLDSLARPTTIAVAEHDGVLKVADSPDLVARVMAGIALSISGVALWLNWQKNERDLAALRPQVAISATRRGTRKWFVKLTVMNPRQVPMAWHKVRAVKPPGLGLISVDREEANNQSSQPLWEYSDYWFVDGHPAMIEPGMSAVWEGYAFIDDTYPVPKEPALVIEPVIDGFDQSPSRLRRIARWIWPSAIKI